MVTEIRNFYSLKELIESLEKDICFCRAAGEEYGERLGAILRDNKANQDNDEWVKELSGLQKDPRESKSKGKSKGKGKGKGKKKGTKSGWIQFKDIMLSTENRGEAQVLFDVIEELKGKVNRLEKIRDDIEDLKRLGLGENIIYIAYLREGIPEKIVLHKKNGDDLGERFEFNATISLLCST